MIQTQLFKTFLRNTGRIRIHISSTSKYLRSNTWSPNHRPSSPQTDRLLSLLPESLTIHTRCQMWELHYHISSTSKPLRSITSSPVEHSSSP
ncbi:hypothetical protein NPIL_601081 [Nephila pilipes]|uniref:Uncharacterized protein n=1 Tax=Nephila pilipes TaxID=299642 RepID=A0A8X6U639_NEPPI|nr:hypothetical protein NPIL_601081 [Nephila pilipes]